MRKDRGMPYTYTERVLFAPLEHLAEIAGDMWVR